MNGKLKWLVIGFSLPVIIVVILYLTAAPPVEAHDSELSLDACVARVDALPEAVPGTAADDMISDAYAHCYEDHQETHVNMANDPPAGDEGDSGQSTSTMTPAPSNTPTAMPPGPPEIFPAPGTTENVCFNAWLGLCQNTGDWIAGWYIAHYGWEWTYANRPDLRGEMAHKPHHH